MPIRSSLLAIASLLVAAFASAQAQFEVGSSITHLHTSGALGPCTTFAADDPAGEVEPAPCRSGFPDLATLLVRVDLRASRDWQVFLTVGDGGRRRATGRGTSVGEETMLRGDEAYRMVIATVGVERALLPGRVSPFLSAGGGVTRLEVDRGRGH